MASELRDLPASEVCDLATLVARAAARWPDRVGLTFDETGERLSFAEIDRRTNRTANALAGLGIGPGDRVGLMLRNHPAFPLTWLALAKLGAVMVPVNVYYRSHDAGYLLAHSGARALVTADEFVPVVTAFEHPDLALEWVISVDGDGGGRARPLDRITAAARDSAPAARVAPEQLVNIQYTSGTSGPPKGCMLSHHFWLFCARMVVAAPPGLGQDDVLLTAQPFTYADPQWNTATALLAGAELVVLDRFHPSSFWAKLRAYRTTFFYCLGVMPTLLMKQPVDRDEREHRLRTVLCSGIPPNLHRAIEERWGVPWHEIYGLTECAFTTLDAPGEHAGHVGEACVGRAAPGRELRVVGPDDRPLARGEVGELVIRGPGMMDGYYRDPEATAAVFRNGWLHTGDLVRMDRAGRVYFVGRHKDYDPARGREHLGRRGRGGDRAASGGPHGGLCARGRRNPGRGGEGLCRARGRPRARDRPARDARRLLFRAARLLQGAALLGVPRRLPAHAFRTGAEGGADR